MKLQLLSAFALVAILSLASAAWFSESETPEEKKNVDPYDYGVDVTYPVHHYIKQDTFFKRQYEKQMNGCYEAYSKRECDATERARLEMSMSQTSHHFNYTEVGFKKMKMPTDLYQKILKFFRDNRPNGEHKENWPRGNTYVNNWESPTTMVSLEDRQLRGGIDLKHEIWNTLSPILSEWIGGKELEPTSMYGIRVYKRGAILAPHVDRLPLPWPAEIFDHNGKAHNVTLLPGEMALYESHTTLHGRPFPLNGNFFANIFVHFKPLEYDEKVAVFQKDLERKESLSNRIYESIVSSKGKSEKGKGGHEHDNHDSETIKRHMVDVDGAVPHGQTVLHRAASRGDLSEVQRLLGGHSGMSGEHADLLHARDENGWQAVHEAVRSGSLPVVQFLLDVGAPDKKAEL